MTNSHTNPTPQHTTTTLLVSFQSKAYVTLLRILLLLSPYLFHPIHHIWLSSPCVFSIFAHPHQTLAHVKEAFAIHALSQGDIYNAHSKIRLPPLVLKFFGSFILFFDNLPYSDMILGTILIIVDFLIAHLIECLGNELIIHKKESTMNDQHETRLQDIMAPVIRPQSAHIFPINSASSNVPSNSTTTTQQRQNDNDDNDIDSLFTMEVLPQLASFIYYASPITALSCAVYGCFQNIPCLFLVASLYESTRPNGSISWSSCLLAMATYIEFHYVVFLIPIGLYFGRQQNDDNNNMNIMIILFFIIWSLCLQGLSYSLFLEFDSNGSFLHVLKECYLPNWDNLQPSLSVIWYFQMELFERFRPYYEILLFLLPFVLIGPLTVRLYHYPMVMVTICWFVWGIFQPIETLYSLNVGLSFLLLSPRSLARMTVVSFIALCSLVVPVVLYVVDWWMWIETASGNANYMFFQCLAYNAFLSIIVGQFCHASLQRDKALRITEKEEQQQQQQQ